jgi:hypothetical protein
LLGNHRTPGRSNAFDAIGCNHPEESAIRLPLLFTIASTVLLVSMDLPPTVPVPEPRPDIGSQSEDGGKPREQSETRTDPKPDPQLDTDTDAKTENQPPETATPPIEPEDQDILAACLSELTTIGAEYRPLARIDDGNGCGIDRPIELRSLGNGVALTPPGILRCRTAVNLARWTRDVVSPMLAKAQPAERLAEVNQASAYICRKRNNAETGKISEHARGTAIDIAGFTFRSGRILTIAPRQ